MFISNQFLNFQSHTHLNDLMNPQDQTQNHTQKVHGPHWYEVYFLIILNFNFKSTLKYKNLKYNLSKIKNI